MTVPRRSGSTRERMVSSPVRQVPADDHASSSDLATVSDGRLHGFARNTLGDVHLAEDPTRPGGKHDIEGGRIVGPQRDVGRRVG